MKLKQPNQPGWYEFSGLRTTPSGKYIVRISDWVKVISGAKLGTYLVLIAGSDQRFSSCRFDGEWELIRAEVSEAA